MLNEGAKIQGKLIEEVEKDHWIVSFKGQLLQVKNSTSIQFQPGLVLNLEVTKAKPIQLKVISSARNKKQGLDIRV